MTTTQRTHTPRPWVQPMRYSPKDGCDIPCGTIEDSKDESIAVCTYDKSPAVTAANANLITAAPDLLEALIQAVDESGHNLSGPTNWRAAEHGEPKWVCNARAAIAKATA